MRTEVIVIGAGVGDLSAALRLAKAGCEVRVLEARSEAGGLASGVHYDGFTFEPVRTSFSSGQASSGPLKTSASI